MILTGAVVGARFCPALTAELTNIAPQPYFAGINRALEAMTKLGAPIASEDARQIAALTRRNDGAAVGAAETILDRYTLTNLLIDSDGSTHVALGGARRMLVEQGWRMFLVRLANPAGRTDWVGVSTDGAGFWDWNSATPGQMVPGWISDAQRASLVDTLNKAPVLEENVAAGTAIRYDSYHSPWHGSASRSTFRSTR
jgi:hypothetical protein